MTCDAAIQFCLYIYIIQKGRKLYTPDFIYEAGLTMGPHMWTILSGSQNQITGDQIFCYVPFYYCLQSINSYRGSQRATWMAPRCPSGTVDTPLTRLWGWRARPWHWLASGADELGPGTGYLISTEGKYLFSGTISTFIIRVPSQRKKKIYDPASIVEYNCTTS